MIDAFCGELGPCFDGSINSARHRGCSSRGAYQQQRQNAQSVISAASKESPMNSLQRYVLALSRVLVSIIFLLNGLGIINQMGAAKKPIEHGAPASLVPFFMLGARTIEVAAGFSLAFGIYPRLAAVAILAFLLPATFTAHAFWQVAGTAAFTLQLLNFLKNTAMVGGLLFIAATISQPALLPRTARSNGRDWMRDESAFRSSARAS
jgi:putative oxidoreductase